MPIPSILPKEFTSKDAPDTLPSNYFDIETGANKAESHPFGDAVWDTVTGPLHPSNWPGLLKNIITGGQPVTDEDWDKAFELADAAHDRDSLLPILTGDPKGSIEQYGGQLVGSALNAAVLGLMLKGATKSKASLASLGDKLNKADTSKDLINAFGNPSDPRFIERSPIGASDIRQHGGETVTGIEHLASTSPTQVATRALEANREVMNRWHTPVQDRGLFASPNQILSKSLDTLKSMADPAKRQALMEDIQHRVSQEKLTPDRLKSLLEEKNGELSGFYSRDPAVQEAAKQAGADTGKSMALLEAQAQAIRDEYYNLLDPKNGGAGPREVQRRYGNIKMLQDEATAIRNKVAGETGGTPLSKAAKSALNLVDVVASPLKEGGVAEGLKGFTRPFKGHTDPLVARAFRNAPEYSPLPEAPHISERYQTTAGVNQLEAGATELGGVSDTSGPVYNERSNPIVPREQKKLGESKVFYQGDVSPGSGGGVESGFSEHGNRNTLPTKSDDSYIKISSNTGKDVAIRAVETPAAARNKVSSSLGLGELYKDLPKRAQLLVDKRMRGNGFSISDLTDLATYQSSKR